MDFTTFAIMGSQDIIWMYHRLCGQRIEGTWSELYLNEVWSMAQRHIDACPVLR